MYNPKMVSECNTRAELSVDTTTPYKLIIVWRHPEMFNITSPYPDTLYSQPQRITSMISSDLHNVQYGLECYVKMSGF